MACVDTLAVSGRSRQPGRVRASNAVRFLAGLTALVCIAVVGSSGAAEASGQSATAHAATAPEQFTQLQQMSDALNRLEYEGTLVYLHDDHLAALRITHRVDNGVSQESLLALNGPIRAVARTERGVTCVLPDAHPILVERKGVTSKLLRSFDGALGHLDEHYLVHPLGSSRVAGRDSSVIGIIPRDRLRYGYRFYLDQATSLPLKIDLMDGAARPIEQVMFTDIAVLGESPAPVDVESRSGEAEPVTPPAGWLLRQMPAGFDLVMYDQEVGSDPVSPMHHLLLSDGLASVSIYIEGNESGGLDGSAQMGAANAVGARIDGHQVTVVGEVPPATVEAVLHGVRSATSTAHH